MMPGLVLGIALLQFFRGFGLTQPWPALMLAHVVVTLPYVARTMIAALSRFDFTLLDAARTLGCSFPAAIFRVMTPALAPAYLTAGLFAFLASMDNYPVSIFLTDARTKTLPIKMLQYIEESPDPTIAALSTLILIATLALLMIADRAVGLHRLAGLAEERSDDRARRRAPGFPRLRPAEAGAAMARRREGRRVLRRQFRGGRGIFD